MDAFVRRALLKPLAKRRRSSADRADLIAAFGRLEERGLGEDLLKQLRGILRDKRPETPEEKLERATQQVALARVLYLSRRISTQEYVILAGAAVEGVHEERVFNGALADELKPIDQAMDALRRRHGLEEWESWRVGEGPKEYWDLEKQWSVISQRALASTFREFRLDDLAGLLESDREEYDRLRERGRRYVYHRDELAAAIRDLVIRYEADARRAALSGAHSAGVILLAAAIEGLLLLRCLRSKQKAHRAATSLSRRLRPSRPKEPATWTFESLIEVCLAAGWLRPVATAAATYNSSGLAHTLRRMRNHVHPGKRVREKPWIEIDRREYDDAAAIYIVLLSSLGELNRIAKAQAEQPVLFHRT